MNQVNENQKVEARSIPPVAKYNRKHLTLLFYTPVIGMTVALACVLPGQSSSHAAPNMPVKAAAQAGHNEVVDESIPPLAQEDLPTANEKVDEYLSSSALSWVMAARKWKSWPDCAEHEALCANYERIEHETPDATRSRIKSIAHDVAVAAATEKGAWPEDPFNARTAVLVLALGFEETLYRGYVDDGRCNSHAWQATSEGKSLVAIGGTCDNTLAHTIWQIHIGDGLVLYDGKEHGDWSHVVGKVPTKVLKDDAKKPLGMRNFVDAENIHQSRLLAARTAWHITRQALRAGHFENLCSYTGELGGICPKGEIRLNFANDWWHKHPLT